MQKRRLTWVIWSASNFLGDFSPRQDSMTQTRMYSYSIWVGLWSVATCPLQKEQEHPRCPIDFELPRAMPHALVVQFE